MRVCAVCGNGVAYAQGISLPASLVKQQGHLVYIAWVCAIIVILLKHALYMHSSVYISSIYNLLFESLTFMNSKF